MNETGFQTLFTLLSLVLCIISTSVMIYVFKIFPMMHRDSAETYAFVSTVAIGAAMVLLLGPRLLWVPISMIVLSVIALLSSIRKFRLERHRANAGKFYNASQPGERVRFLRLNHVLDILLPSSFLGFAVTTLIMVIMENKVDWTPMIIFRSFLVLLTFSTAVLNQLQDFGTYWQRKNMLTQLTLNHTLPRRPNQLIVIFEDTIEAVTGNQDNASSQQTNVSSEQQESGQTSNQEAEGDVVVKIDDAKQEDVDGETSASAEHHAPEPPQGTVVNEKKDEEHSTVGETPETPEPHSLV